MYRLHLQSRKIRERGKSVSRWLQTESELEAIRSFETPVHTRSKWRHIPEDGILHSHRRENLKSYVNGLLLRVLKKSAKKLRIFGVPAENGTVQKLSTVEPR
jgi:hypothetical protein